MPMAHDYVGVTGRDEKCDLKQEKLLRRVCISNFLRMEVFLVMKNMIKCSGTSGAFLSLCSWGTQRVGYMSKRCYQIEIRKPLDHLDNKVLIIPLTILRVVVEQ